MGFLFSRPEREDPTHAAIEEANRLRREQEIRDEAARAAREEAARLTRAAELEAKRAQEAEEAMNAARAEADRIRREAEDARIAAAGESERREQEIREEARKAAEAVEEELLRQKAQAAEDRRRADEARRAAEKAQLIADGEARAARAAQEKAEEMLREGIQPVVMPSSADLALAKKRINYRDDLYHFAVVGLAGSGKSTLINALRGLRSRDPGAAPTGITETTLRVGRYPDSSPENPFVWYDVPGAGTLLVRDWQYFNEQGLYVFDALIVLVDNRFTETDIAILRNAKLFNIPCYIVRSKADGHIRNVMREWGWDSQDEDDEPRNRAELEGAARDHFVSGTRANVQSNLLRAKLPDQRVYIVSNNTMYGAVKRSKKAEKNIIDELQFLQDLLGDAHERRGTRVSTVSSKSGHM